MRVGITRSCTQRSDSSKTHIPILLVMVIGLTITRTHRGATTRWPTISSGRCLMVVSTCTLSRRVPRRKSVTTDSTTAISRALSTMITKLSNSALSRCPHPTGTTSQIGATTTMVITMMAAMPRKTLSALVLRQIAQQSR